MLVEIGADGIVYRHTLTASALILAHDDPAKAVEGIDEEITNGRAVLVEWTATDTGRVVTAYVVFGKDKVDFVRGIVQ